MRGRYWFGVAAVIAVVAAAIMGPRVVAKIAPPAPPQLATASHRSFNAIVSASGTVVPANQVNANFLIPGTLTEIDVSVGQQVHKGQVLARIDPANGQSAVASAQAGVQAASASVGGAQAAVNDAQAAAQITDSADLAQMTMDCAGANSRSPQCATDTNRLNTDRAASRTRIDQARAQVASAQAQLAQAQAQLQQAQAGASQTILTAPIDGVAIAINGHVGENVQSGSSAGQQSAGSTAPLPGNQPSQPSGFIVLSDNSGFQVVAPFAEVDAAQLKAGQDATVSFDAIPNVVAAFKLVAVAQGASVVSSAVNYYATLAPVAPDPRYKNGMTANVQIPVARVDNVLAVPSQAIYTLDQKLYIDVWYQNRAVATQVTIGLVGDHLTEIKSGIKDGDQVVLSTHHNQTTQGSGSGPSLFGR